MKVKDLLDEGGIFDSSLVMLKDILHMSGYDLRCTPLVKRYIEIFNSTNKENVTKAYEIYKAKYESMPDVNGRKKLAFQYFTKVLENLTINEPITNTSWGKDI